MEKEKKKESRMRLWRKRHGEVIWMGVLSEEIRKSLPSCLEQEKQWECGSLHSLSYSGNALYC